MKLSIIVALSENRAIGKDGQMPWHLSDDLKRFKKITMGHPIIMGRKTHESIGRVLPGRENVVLSRSGAVIDGVSVYASLDEAITALAREHDEAFVIGGGQIYELALARADRLYLTQIHDTFAGDTFFPAFDEDAFTELSCESFNEPFAYSYRLLQRK